jgi:hypothetical protein
MTKFMNKTFSSAPANQAYRDNYDAVFGEKAAELTMVLPPDPNVRLVGPCDCICHKHPLGEVKHCIPCCTGDFTKPGEG